MTQQAMDPVEVDPDEDGSTVEAGPDEGEGLVILNRPGTGEVEDEGLDLSEALMALPALLLLVANGATVAGATAWQAGGALGLAGTAAAAGGSAGAGALVRRAHRAETRRRQDENEVPGRKPPARPGAGAPASRAAARDARRGTGAGGTGRTGGPRTGPGAARRAGGLRPPGTGAARRGTGMGAGRAAGAASPNSGAGRAGAGAGGGRSGRLGQLATRAGSSAAARRAAGSAPGRAGAAGLGSARRAGAAGAGAIRRAGASSAGAARRAGAAGSARVGRGTHAMTGSRAGRVAAGAGRRATSAGRATAGGLRRAGSAARSGLAGARQARGQNPIAKARAVRAALSTARERLDRESGRRAGRLTRFRRWVNSAGAGLGIALLAGSWSTGRGMGRWGRWAVQAVQARRTGRPIPPTPTKNGRRLLAQRLAAAQQDDAGHPPVGDQVNEPPAHLGRVAPRASDVRGAQQMSKLGLFLEDLSGQMAAAAAMYTPEGMLEWGQDMAMLETVLTNVAAVLEALEKGANDLPIEPTVRGTIGTVASLQHACADAADDIHSTFRAVHADELARLENPRPAEHKWDLGANQ